MDPRRRNRVATALACAFAVGLAAAPLASQQGKSPGKGDPKADGALDPALGAALGEFRQWLADYNAGAVRLVKEGRTDDAAVAALDALMTRLAATQSLAAARLLFDAAGVEPKPAGDGGTTHVVDFQRELQPWRVQGMALRHLRTIAEPSVIQWLVGMLKARGLRAAKANDDQRNAATALRVCAGHPSLEVQIELGRAARSLPPELRVLAADALARHATIESVPTLLDLLRDAEPNIRIAAANALGVAMQPLVDESLGMRPEGELLKLRDQVIARLEQLLVQDQVWQVRSAAAFALAIQKCKPVVPALIRGLAAELGRKKDPWAMDLRLHRLLEGLTGQSVAFGDVAPWQQFWQQEGAAFTVKPKDGEPTRGEERYHRFFDLEVASDRVLFVLDFSGSMAETVTLRTKTTGAAPGTTTTKAALVVAELKKLVSSLPDGALVNFVVFNDEVRIWRQEGNRPALVKLDDDARDDLLGHFLDGLRPAGATNLYGALDAALEFGGRALYDKYYQAGFDTLYVISDGAPTAGAVVDKDEIRRRVRAANGLRKIAIQTITFGDQNDTDFLRSMAEENGGRHIHVE